MKLGTLWHYQYNMKALESLTHILLPVFRKHHCSFCLSDPCTVTCLPSRGQSRTTKTKSKEAAKQYKLSESAETTQLEGKLASNVKRAMQVASEKGASSWLATLPIAEHGFPLHKCAFRDALCLWYGWRPSQLLSYCICGQHFKDEHALIGTHGGFPLICHNEPKDITAGFLTEVCHNVGIEPPLQPSN